MSQRGGASLMEVILSVTIIALALTLLVGMLPSASLSARLARQRTLAGGLAQDYLESLDPSALGSLTSPPAQILTLEGTPFRREVKVSALPSPSAARRVRVEVSWTHQQSRHGQSLHRVFREIVMTELRP